MAKMIVVQLFLTMEIIQHLPLRPLDIKNVFPHAYLKVEFYMDQPPRFVTNKESSLVCKLYCSLYGFKLSPCTWFGNFNHIVQTIRLKRSEDDHYVFY